jgi:hypothetical protein
MAVKMPEVLMGLSHSVVGHGSVGEDYPRAPFPTRPVRRGLFELT